VLNNNSNECGAVSSAVVSSSSSAADVVSQQPRPATARLHEADVRLQSEVVVEPQQDVTAVRNVETSVVARHTLVLAQPQPRQFSLTSFQRHRSTYTVHFTSQYLQYFTGSLWFILIGGVACSCSVYSHGLFLPVEFRCRSVGLLVR